MSAYPIYDKREDLPQLEANDGGEAAADDGAPEEQEDDPHAY